MTPPLIQLDSISKCYRIFQNPQDRFKQALLDQFQNVLGRKNANLLYREHWALQDVSFELQAGEAVGIVGRNGAGKSTLLQIIAGTLAPTSGQVKTFGRITALLELGSGFNPEFSGRENIFLNAQILGVSREKIEKRFEEIERFAEIGDFIEQPIKTYSSGMIMRLAFAVQTLLEPNVMIIDEALAVGDAKFQEKCFRKLRELKESGVGILFVSHDINSVTSFCERAILMNAGKVMLIGSPDKVAQSYIKVLYSENDANNSVETTPPSKSTQSTPPSKSTQRLSLKNKINSSGRFGNKKVEILSVEIINSDGNSLNHLISGRSYKIVYLININEDIDYLSTGIIIKTIKSVDIFGTTNKTLGYDTHLALKKGQMFEIEIEIDMWLSAGEYILQVATADERSIHYDCMPSAISFTVIGTPELFTTSIVNLSPKLSLKEINIENFE